MGNCAGVDWASEKHDVLIADASEKELLAGTFAHDEPGIRSLCAALIKRDVELVAIERPDGLLVERLLETFRSWALHPNQVKAARDRFRASGGSPTASTASCCTSSLAPIVTGSGCWSRLGPGRGEDWITRVRASHGASLAGVTGAAEWGGDGLRVVAD